MRGLKMSRKVQGVFKKMFAVMLISTLVVSGTIPAFASDAYTSADRNHGTIAVTAENEVDNVINMNQGDEVAITVSPYVHVQYQGCDNNAGCPDACGDIDGGCFFEGYGCNCITTPTKRITKVDTSTTNDGIISIGDITAAKTISDEPATSDLSEKCDGTFLIKAESVGTTELTISTSLRDWVYTTKTYTVNVSEKPVQPIEVFDFDAETTHAGFKDGETNSLQTLFVDLDFEKELKIVDKAALLEEMNILSKAYVKAQQDGDLAEGKSFVVFGAGLKPEQTDVELINGNKTLRITTKGWGAQVAGIFKAVGKWTNLRSVDGEPASVNATIIIPNGISTEIVKQVIATENTKASVTTKVIRPADATRGMVHWMLLKNGEPVAAKYDTGLGFNQVGATFNAHLHNYASDTAVDFTRNSVNTMIPLLSDYYDIEYKEGSDEFTVTAKDSQPGDILELHIYSYLNNGSKTNDLSALKEAVESAGKVDKKLYTAGSYEAFSDALAKAQVIVNSPTYYAQTDIDFAKVQLLNAQKNLVKASEKIVYTKKPAKVTVALSTAKHGYDNVKVSWSKVTGAAGYKVYYKKTSSSKWSSVTVKNKTSYTTKSLTDGAKYEFKVYPYITSNGKDYVSSKCTTASIYTLKKVSTPKVTKSGSKVKVRWTNINGESGYQISKSTKKNGTKIVATYKTTTGKYKIVKAKKGTKYYYKVRAYKNVKVGSKTYKVYGPWSNVKSYRR